MTKKPLKQLSMCKSQNIYTDHNIMTTLLILHWSPLSFKTVLIRRGMDSTRRLKVCWSICTKMLATNP